MTLMTPEREAQIRKTIADEEARAERGEWGGACLFHHQGSDLIAALDEARVAIIAAEAARDEALRTNEVQNRRLAALHAVAQAASRSDMVALCERTQPHTFCSGCAIRRALAQVTVLAGDDT